MFSISYARDFIDRGMIDVTGSETTWNNWVPIKVNILIWRIRLHNIPNRERLSDRGIKVESIIYPVFRNAVETIDHIFTGCTDLLDIWKRVAIWWNVLLPNQASIPSLSSWAEFDLMRSSQRKAFVAVVLKTFWSIWNFRNSMVFGTTIPRKFILFDDIIDRLYFWISNRCNKAKLSRTSSLHNPALAYSLL